MYFIESYSEVKAHEISFSCAPQNFESTYAIQQQTLDGSEPFGVTGQEISVESGTGGVAFSNVGGVLSIADLSFTNSQLMAGVSTGTSTQAQQGATMLTGLTVTTSNIMVSFFKLKHSKFSF